MTKHVLAALLGALLFVSHAPSDAQDMCRLAGQNCPETKPQPKPRQTNAAKQRPVRDQRPSKRVRTYDLTFGNNGSDRGEAVARTDREHVMLAGYRWHESWEVVKVHVSGETKWAKTYKTEDLADLIDIQSDGSGGAFLIGRGFQRLIEPKGYFGIVMRVDHTGRLLWKKTFPNSGSFVSATSNGDGAVAIATIRKLSDNKSHGKEVSELIIKNIGRDGSLEWESVLGEYSGASGKIGFRNTSNGYLIVGEAGHKYELVSGRQTSAGWLVKLDRSGRRMWERSYRGNGVTRFRDVASLKNGQILVVGIEFGPEPHSSTRLLVQKLSSDGESVWAKTYGVSEHDVSNAIIEAADSNFVIVGESQNKNDRSDLLLMKLSSSGKVVWRRTFGGETNDMGNAILKLDDGGLLIAGSNSSKSDNYDMWLLKTDSSGRLN